MISFAVNSAGARRLDMTRLVSAIVILLGVSAVSALGQQLRAETLSYADKNAIVESVLEVKNYASPRAFPFIPTVSSDNIDFVDSSLFTKRGFRLVSASALRESKKENLVDYLVFRKISFRDGVGLVILAHVTEGRPCFAPTMYKELSYTYEVRRTSEGLIAKLTRGPVPSLDLNRFGGAR